MCEQASQLWPAYPHQRQYYIETTRRKSSPGPTWRVHCGGRDSLSHYSIIPRCWYLWHFSHQTWERKTQVSKSKTEVLDCQTTNYLPIASSLGGATTLPRYRSSTPGLPGLGISAWSRAEFPITPLPSFLLICIIKIIHKYCLYETSYEHIYTWLIDREIWKNKRMNKCLGAKGYS